MVEINTLDPTDTSNTARFPEGMRVNNVNNAARSLEGILARWYQDNNGTIAVTGTTTCTAAINVDTGFALYDGYTIVVDFTSANTGAVTLNLTPDGGSALGAKAVELSGGVALISNDITAGQKCILMYNGTSFQILSNTSGVVSATSATTLTNKTLTSPVLNTGVSGTAVLDEDTMSSDSATQIATQQSIKAYADGRYTAAIAATAADVISTAADVVSTNADVVTTNQDALDTAADVVLTNADVVSTNADVVLTNADVGTTGTSETNAAASAAAAAVSAGSNLFSKVATKTTAYSIVANTDDGTLYIADMSSGNVAFTLPDITTALEGERYGFLRSGASNVMTFIRNGTDTINGVAGTFTVDANDGTMLIIVADEASPDNWVVIPWSQTDAGAGLSKAAGTMSLDLTSDQAWTGSQRATTVALTDGTLLDMNTAQDWDWTPAAADVLSFANITNGQRGMILLNNPSAYAITKAAAVHCDADFLSTVSAAGVYACWYWADASGSIVYVGGSPALAT